MGVVFVKRCILCGELLPAAGTGKAMLCPACAGEVRQSYRCTEPVCITGADDAAAALYYTGKVQHAMQGLKFHHKQHYADWFAAPMLPLTNADVHSKSVVFVDDIITTGATATAAVKLLREMGAIKIYVLAAARTHRE